MKQWMKAALLCLTLTGLMAGLTGCRTVSTGAKPVIYLYPEETEQVDAKPTINLYPEDTEAPAKPVINVYPEEAQTFAKPVDYLYSPSEMQVRVELDYDGTLTSTWPVSPEGVWEVTALPNGTLYDQEGNQYSYLFWEGDTAAEYDFSQGFVVSGAETGEFLREILAEIGLTPREYNEFIVYWLPKMEGNPYNLIAFQGEAYTDHARLTITPEPDSLLRVFMAWKAIDQPVELPPQSFDTFQREGFTVVEWGGTQVID